MGDEGAMGVRDREAAAGRRDRPPPGRRPCRCCSCTAWSWGSPRPSWPAWRWPTSHGQRRPGGGAQSTSRQVGPAFGTAILGTVLFSALGAQLSQRLSRVPAPPAGQRGAPADAVGGAPARR